jgi:hypothetical protein
MPAFDLLGRAEPLMKRYYDDRTVYSAAYKDRPLLAWIPKKTGVTGGSPLGNAKGGYQVPLTIDDIVGESAQFASAVTARDGDSHVVWDCGRIKRYATATIDWETVRAMKNDVGAFMRAITPRIDSAINQLSNSLQVHLYGDGSGHRGVVGSIATNTITLDAATAHLARTWSLRRTLVSTETASGGTLQAGSTKVNAINSAAGAITVDSVAAITGLDAGDYIFPLGDYQVSGAALIMNGLKQWGPDPATITAGNPFKGVDRATWKEKLLMLHFTAMADNSTIDSDVREAVAQLKSNGGNADALFLHPSRWSALETKLASQSRYEMLMGTDKNASTGFDTIVINAGGRRINVVSDPWCPPAEGWLLQRNTWELFSIDRVPDFVSDDGGRLHRLEGADEVEFRIGGYYNLVCRCPGHNMKINFTGT